MWNKMNEIKWTIRVLIEKNNWTKKNDAYWYPMKNQIESESWNVKQKSNVLRNNNGNHDSQYMVQRDF